MNNKLQNKLEQTTFFYAINFPPEEEILCQLEMKVLFGFIPEGKYFFSTVDVNPSTSPFIKERIALTHRADSLQALVKKIEKDNLPYEDFRVNYIRVEGEGLSYQERLESTKAVAIAIPGEANLHEPKITVGVAKYEDKWLFGIYEANDLHWHEHDNKPYTYSHSLSVRVARALVNIAVGNNRDCTLVDPCCGVGTVVIEALDLGVNVQGYEINRKTAWNAKRNLAFFGLEDVIIRQDMHTVEEHYDVAIIDIPYGIIVPISKEDQVAIIRSARRIANKLVIIMMEDMDEMLKEEGWNIVDSAIVTKGNFKRYIRVCE
ncbi:MAG: TRM11 family SAM-dependent methyltransferase [Bacillaceae bacterium]